MIIGMDFGTTNSGLASYDGQHLQLIPIDGNAIARTALYVTNDRQFYVGRQAIDTYFAQNLGRPFSIKRVWVGEISLSYAELPEFMIDVYIDKDVLAPGRLFVSFKSALSMMNYVGTVVGSHFYYIEDIVALYLYMAKTRAEAVLGQEIKRIALGRPVRFAFDAKDDALARERLLRAAFHAGYEEVFLQYEPIAAAAHYEASIDREQIVLVFDFGGGTLDLSVLRVGDPKHRDVLATGGVPIAGDVFDSKLARARLPKHFGEGSSYRSEGQRLPVPSSFYEAFSNWQEMLTLQRPDMFQQIERIEQTAQRPHQLRALRNLVSSSYGLKMFDIVEAAKRQLSTNERASIHLQGQGFDVVEPVGRGEFEAIIGPDVRLIEEYLDNLLRDAGLQAEDIDVVIRTGGSSQIPAFVRMLETRFGSDKVRALDTFSSVTSGLGIIGHRIETGELEAQSFRSSDFPPEQRSPTSVPSVEFEVLKKYVTLTEGRTEKKSGVGVVALADDGALHASLETPDAAGLAAPRMMAASADEPLLLMTSEYRFMLKTTQQLATLDTLGLSLAESEGFHSDAFGSEYLSGIARWRQIKPETTAVLISTSGHFKIFKGEALISRVEQSVGYQPERIRGYPFALVGGTNADFVVAFNTTGRAVRLPITLLQETAEGRLMKLSADDHLIAAFAVPRTAGFLLAGTDGTIMHLRASAIPLVNTLQDPGHKLFPKRELQAVTLWTLDSSFWIATNQRVRLHDADGIPSGKIVLNKGETLVSLLA